MKKLEKRSGLNISPGRVYDAPHGIPGISPVDARSQRGHPYTVPCRSCADMAITWGSCTGPGISRTLAVVRTAPCLRDMKKREKKNEFYFELPLLVPPLVKNPHLVKCTRVKRVRVILVIISKGSFSHRFPRKRKKSLAPLLEIQSLILVTANK